MTILTLLMNLKSHSSSIRTPSCGNSVHYGYNCPPKDPIISNPEPCYNQNVDEFPQTLPSFHLTCNSGDENSFTYDSNLDFVDDSPNPPSQPPAYFYEFCRNDAHYGHDCPPQHAFREKQHQQKDLQELLHKLLEDLQIIREELADYINTLNWNCPTFFDDDDDEYTIQYKEYLENSCIAITPVLSTEEPVDSLIIGDEHLSTIPETKSDELTKSSVEDLVPIPSESEEEVKDVDPEDGEIDTDIRLTIEDDVLREKLLIVNLLIAKIEALKDNPTPSSDFVTKSSSTSPNLFLEETNTFDNSLPESETFCFDLEENSNGSTTTRSDYSLPDYEAFYFDDDHIEEKSSGSTTTHSDISLSKYDSFIFDLSNDPFPPADRSDFYHEKFADELAHIISLPEYACFYFRSEPDPGYLTSIDPGIRENVSSTTNVNLPFEDNQSPLFAYVVWIFFHFLTYPVAPPYLLSSRNEDTIFDPVISIYHSFMPSVSYRSETFMKFNVYPNHLNESPMEILSSICFPMDQ
ncbi:hypothetical protein Tco_0533939 [Tanacetum coccineum]